jgi:hypothetical protein
MQPNRYLAVFSLLNALTLCVLDKPVSAGQGKESSVNRGEKAKTQMSAKRKENTNAQWSADPNHGWVRADERHELQARRKSDESSKQGREKQKGKADKTEKLIKKGNY